MVIRDFLLRTKAAVA